MSIQLSPRKLNLFMECERCFWLAVNKKVRRPSGPFPSLPGGMDGIIKDHFDAFRGDGAAPPVVDRADIGAVPHPDEELLERARKWQVEPWYEHPERDVVVKGAVDDLLLDADDNIIVLDYKTRGYPPKEAVPGYYRRQVNLYNLILRANGFSTADTGLLLYYYPDRINEAGDILFHTEFHEVPVDMAAARGLVDDAIDVIDGDLPAPNEDCDFCTWSRAEHDAL